MFNKCVTFVEITLLRMYSKNAAAVRNISLPFGFMTISNALLVRHVKFYML